MMGPYINWSAECSIVQILWESSCTDKGHDQSQIPNDYWTIGLWTLAATAAVMQCHYHINTITIHQATGWLLTQWRSNLCHSQLCEWKNEVSVFCGIILCTQYWISSQNLVWRLTHSTVQYLWIKKTHKKVRTKGHTLSVYTKHLV